MTNKQQANHKKQRYDFVVYYEEILGVKPIYDMQRYLMTKHNISLFVKPKYTTEPSSSERTVYFDSFGIEHIPKEINKFINNDTTKSSSLKRIKSNIFRIQAYDSIMCRYFCIEFINYMLKGKTLLDYTNLFSPNDFKKNGRIIKRIFKNE